MSSVQMFGENYRGLYSTPAVGPADLLSLWVFVCLGPRMRSPASSSIDSNALRVQRPAIFMLALWMSLTVIDGRI